jgi:hypothetical protein
MVYIPGIGSDDANPFPDFRVSEKLEFYNRNGRTHRPVYRAFGGEDSELEATCPRCGCRLRMLLEVEHSNGGKYAIKKAVLHCGDDPYTFDIKKDREVRLKDGRFSFP